MDGGYGQANNNERKEFQISKVMIAVDDCEQDRREEPSVDDSLMQAMQEAVGQT
jgi:hypothetical protein